MLGKIRPSNVKDVTRLRYNMAVAEVRGYGEYAIIGPKLEHAERCFQAYVDACMASPKGCPPEVRVDLFRAISALSSYIGEPEEHADKPELHTGNEPASNGDSDNEPIVSRPDKDADSDGRANRPDLDFDSMACAYRVAHSDWTMQELAKSVGCTRGHLYRLRKFGRLRELLKQGKERIPNGLKTQDDFDAWDPD